MTWVRAGRGLVAIVLLVIFCVSSHSVVFAQGIERKNPHTISMTGSAPYLDVLEAYLRGSPRNRTIVDGEKAEQGQIPWQVALLAAGVEDRFEAHFCGGTLIKPDWVVTAAHCLDPGMQPYQLEVMGGAVDLDSNRGKRVKVSKIIVHPKYDSVTVENDVALLHLEEPLIGSNISPIPVISPAEEARLTSETRMVVSGWGFTSEGGPLTPDLMWGRVLFIDRDKCNDIEIYDGGVTDSMLCAGHLEGGADACGFDSGGPLVLESDEVKLVGIVSWGVGCGRKNKPGVYARAAIYSAWIYAQMQMDSNLE